MKNLITLFLLVLITSPSYACACRGGSPIDTIVALTMLFLAPFLLFSLVGYFRDSKHIFRYASIITFPTVLIFMGFLFLVILSDINPDGEYFILVILISLIGSIHIAEKKAKNSKVQETKTIQDLSV